MRKILLSDLRDISAKRSEGYYEELVSAGHIETADILVLDDKIYADFLSKYAPAGRPASIIPQPIPRKDWPLWAKALAMIAKPEDKGIGDVVARTIGSENSEAFKKWYKATTGKDCGCTGRQLRWNIEYPLNLKAT